MDNILHHSTIISDTLGQKSFSYLNSVSMKYRYEKMKFLQIASKLRPNLRREQGNLFERLSFNRCRNLDKDILISQKALQKIKSNPGIYSLSNLFDKSKALNQSDEPLKKGNEIPTINETQTKRFLSEDKLSNIGESLIAINSSLNAVSELTPGNFAKLPQSPSMTIKEKEEKDTVTATQYKKTFTPIYNSNKLIKHSQSTKHFKEFSPAFHPIRQPYAYLNDNSLKMKFNLSKEKKEIEKKINDSSSSSRLLDDNKDIRSNSLGKTTKIIKYDKQANKRYTLKQLLSLADSIETALPNRSNRQRDFGTFNDWQKQSSSSRKQHSFLSEFVGNYNSGRRNHQTLMPQKKVYYSKEALLKRKEALKMNMIKQLNMKSIQKYYQQIKINNSQKMQNEAKRIQDVHSKMFCLLNKFESEFSKRINKFSMNQSVM